MLTALLRKSLHLVGAKPAAPATPSLLATASRFYSSSAPSASDNTEAATILRPPTILPLAEPAFGAAATYQAPRQLWIENLDTVAEHKRGLIDLHPAVFAGQPRIDVIHQNVEWQRKYRYVSFANTKSRSEVRGGGRKPWPQKGLGRARHGSIRSPLWRGGGIVHGPRSPTTHFYMLPVHHRVAGLVAALSVKLAQNDLHVVDELELPVEDPEYLKQLLEERVWGESVLFVDREDVVSRNVAIATDAIPHVHVMPAYGLNVYSMLKYQTLVLTVDAAQHIQEKLLLNMNRNDATERGAKFQLNRQ